jgi:hypothetical protein
MEFNAQTITQRMPLVEQKLITIPERLRSPLFLVVEKQTKKFANIKRRGRLWSLTPLSTIFH